MAELKREKWPSFLREIVETTEKVYLDTSGDTPPHVHVLFEGDRHQLLFISELMEPENKYLLEPFLLQLVEQGAREICLVSEVYVNEQLLRRGESAQLSHVDSRSHAETREELMVMHLSVSGDVMAAAQLLPRHRLGSWRVREFEYGSATGRLVNTFGKVQARNASRN